MESAERQNPDPAESQDATTEASYEERSSSEGHDLPEDQQNREEEIQVLIIKEEETDDEEYLYGGMSSPVTQQNEEEEEEEEETEDEDYIYGGASSSVDQQNEEDKDYLYCELCKSFFINKCELHGPALFISDSPVPMGVPDRARKTLPSGLEVQKSSIPDAGLGVFNKGQTVPVGAHFGPYQGDVVEREEAMNSGYSWVIYRSRKCEEYIDAKREMNANWMRYVNCARTDEEQNLVAFQYGGGILYRSCRPIEPGQELLVWYGEDYVEDLHRPITFDHIWNIKCSANGTNDDLLEDFPCPLCPLSYTSQIYLDKHIKRRHIRGCYVKLLKLEEDKFENPTPAGSSSSLETPTQPLGSNSHHEQMQKYLSSLQIEKNVKEEDKTYQYFPYEQSFIYHYIQTVAKPYQCSQCGKCFSRHSNLRQHQHVHTGEKLYQCSQCGKSFAHQSSLKRHRLFHTGEKPYPCTQCEKSFTRQNSLQQHLRVHTGEKPFQCSQCGRSFTQQAHLQQHQHIHTREKTYPCPQCGQKFTCQSSVTRHQRIHTGEKPYPCSQCEKSFTRQSGLQQHQRVHTGEKPYSCSQCAKSFSGYGVLQRHMRLHNGEKSYHCSECGKSFSFLHSLQRHLRLHTGEKPYQCLQCDESFAFLRSLQQHHRVHVGDITTFTLESNRNAASSVEEDSPFSEH